MRSADGLWVVHRERAGGPAAGGKADSQFDLPRVKGHELEAMLSNPCLYAEPALIGNEYPTASGESGHCRDGANTFVDIYFEGRRRAAVQACDTYGLTGKLVKLIREPQARSEEP